MTHDADAAPAPQATWLMVPLLLFPLGVTLAKLLPISPAFSGLIGALSIPAELPESLHRQVDYIIFVALGALVVSFVRLTLGIHVLGLFRPILLAVAFSITGIPLGVAFLLFVLSVVPLLRPLLRKTPYYARVPAIVSFVAALLLTPVIANQWWLADWVNRLAYFPIIALGLACEGVVKIMDTKGVREAAWRLLTTILAAVVLTAIVKIPGLVPAFFHFPELLLVETGLILVISKYCNFRWFEGKNPFNFVPAAANPGSRGARPPVERFSEATVRSCSFDLHQADLPQGQNI
jgi:hypothetical protein